MSPSIRAMRSEDARRFLEIQRESVRGLAAGDYPTAVIEAWAPLPITDAVVERFLSNQDGEMRLIAETDGQAVGIGALVPRNSELRACYVLPGTARRGSARRSSRRSNVSLAEMGSPTCDWSPLLRQNPSTRHWDTRLRPGVNCSLPPASPWRRARCPNS